VQEILPDPSGSAWRIPSSARLSTWRPLIECLFAFCFSEGKEEVPICNKESLGQAFEKAKEMATCDGTPLATELPNL
jgi:hypothetical protein